MGRKDYRDTPTTIVVRCAVCAVTWSVAAALSKKLAAFNSLNRREVILLATFAPPKPLTERIAEARRRARLFRTQGETELADRWDDRCDQLLDQLPR